MSHKIEQYQLYLSLIDLLIHLYLQYINKEHLFCMFQELESLLTRYENGNKDNLVTLVNKSPSWNEQTQSYVLNFHGRVTQASVKNFQIVHPDNGMSF